MRFCRSHTRCILVCFQLGNNCAMHAVLCCIRTELPEFCVGSTCCCPKAGWAYGSCCGKRQAGTLLASHESFCDADTRHTRTHRLRDLHLLPLAIGHPHAQGSAQLGFWECVLQGLRAACTTRCLLPLLAWRLFSQHAHWSVSWGVSAPAQQNTTRACCC